MRRLRALCLIISLVCAITPGAAYGINEEDHHSINYDSIFYSNEEECNTGDVSGQPGGGGGNPSQEQADNAKTIIGIAKTLNLGRQGALIGLMVGLAESSLLNYANTKVPISLTNPDKQATGSDGLSVGIMQQQVGYGWGTIKPDAITNKDAVFQLMTQAYAAESFFSEPVGKTATPNLMGIPNWQNMDPAMAAQDVQASAFSDGSNYRAQEGNAQQLLDKYYVSAPKIPLPVPLKGGPGGTPPPPSYDCSGTGSGNIAGCVNPFTDGGWGLQRTDQGVDYIPQTPRPVRAVCDGKIVSTNGCGVGCWPGNVFIEIKMTSGPFIGKCTYVAEHLTNFLGVGTEVHAGERIATALPGFPWTEWGWAEGYITPSTPYNGAADGTAMPGGKAFARFIIALGGKSMMDPGPGPLYDGGSCGPNG